MSAEAEKRPDHVRGGLRGAAPDAVAFTLYTLRRFNADGCFAACGALSYAALVSLVPLAVIALGTLSVLPVFSQLHDQILALVFKYFVPSIGEQAGWWFRAFANSAAQTTAIGVVGITATGVLLLATVEDQLNLIWRVTAPRPWGQRVLAYWALITLGPLLIGLSLSLSTYFEIAARRAGFCAQSLEWLTSSWLHGVARAIPALLEFFALSLLYWLIPNCLVRLRDAARGALMATIAIEILKIGFTIYIGAMSYYQTVYGALSAIPIFLLWMYVSWLAVLFGAEVAAALPLWRIDERIGSGPGGGVRLGLSLALLAALNRAQRRGASLTTQALANELGIASTVIDEHLEPLAAAGFVAHTQSGSWVLSWNPETATLRDLYDALHLPFAGSWLGNAAAPWQRQIEPAVRRIVDAEAAAAGMTIAALLATAEEGPGADQPPPAEAPSRRRAANRVAVER